MKKIFLLTFFTAIVIAGYCAPLGFQFNYQAVVRDGSGTLVGNGATVAFRFSILDGSAAGPILYSETQNVVVNNTQGLVSLQVGNGTTIIGSGIGGADFNFRKNQN